MYLIGTMHINYISENMTEVAKSLIFICSHGTIYY